MSTAATIPCLLRIREVRNMTGLTRSALYQLMREGTFPRPVKLTERSVAWIESEVRAWIEARIRAAREAA